MIELTHQEEINIVELCPYSDRLWYKHDHRIAQAQLQKVRDHLQSPEMRKAIKDILEPTLDRLYHQDLPEGKYEEIAIKASICMLKGNLTTQILSLIGEVEK